MYILYMTRQYSISEARQRLPELVRCAQRGEIVDITVRDEVVARLTPARSNASSLAKKVLALRKKLEKEASKGGPTDVSSRKSEYLTRRPR